MKILHCLFTASAFIFAIGGSMHLILRASHRALHAILIACIATASLILVSSPPVQVQAACSLHNPVLVGGADPSVWFRNGNYYLTQSDGNNKIYLRASATIGGLNGATNRVIWTAPA